MVVKETRLVGKGGSRGGYCAVNLSRCPSVGIAEFLIDVVHDASDS